MDEYNLNRFIEAQENDYPVALRELQQGEKRSHWMWYIFPQLKGLGFSYYSNFYGISGREEAAAYLAHPVLGKRLREVTEMILNLPVNDAAAIFGGIDAQKLRSSMTLFDAVCPNNIFSAALAKYFDAIPDTRTLTLLN